MSEVCVFAGTTEGRRLLQFLAGQDVRVLACVATGYGERLIPEAANIEVSAGRLGEAGMVELLASRPFDEVIDATHPFATQVSQNIAAACAATGIACTRLSRGDAAADGDAILVDSIVAAAEFLSRHPGNALLTTGTRALEPFTRVPGFQERLYARVLPMEDSLRACAEAGFAPSHVIAMQGPFSVEMNAATLKAARADWLVTKASGDGGGFAEKMEAARLTGARCVVVGRPEQAGGLSFAETVARLTARYGLRDVREIDVLGVGMGGAGTLTFEAAGALEACDCLIGAPRLLEALSRFGKAAFAEISPERIVGTIADHPEYRRVAVAMSGDTGFFSGTKRLLPLLAGHRVRVLPGLSSMQVLCARLGTTWDDVRAISLHGRAGSAVPDVLRYGRVFVLTDGADALRRVCADLCAAGLGDARIAVGQRLSYPDEAILMGTAATLCDAECAPLSALLIEYPAKPAPLPVGLPDTAFLREAEADGRIVPMTKSEVRAVSISKLKLTEDAVVWDVGAGTGSVSVEAALLCPRGRVWAVECREDAANLIEKNARRFALRNLEIVRGRAPEALLDLPAPTHVFIGGSGGSLREIVEAALEKNPRARIVENAIAMESVAALTRLMDETGFDEAEIVQLSVARGKKVGGYRLMEGLNPVWIGVMQNHGGGEAHEGQS